HSDWRPGLTKLDLAAEISAKLDHLVPEIAGAISQPIQMRTNELVAGIRSDVGIVVYGRDLERLALLGDQIARLVKEVRGAVDVRIEQVAGLEYLRVIPERSKLVRYG